MAAIIGVHRTTIALWISSGSIPQKYWQLIIDRGARAGILVTPFCFVADLRAANPEDFRDAA